MLAAFRMELRQFLAFSEKASARLGLTQQQYQALLAMRAHAGRLTISDLAAEMLIKHHSAVGMVNRLEQQGMVRREASSADRRKVDISLTEHGVRVFAKLASVHWAELRRIAPELERFFGHFARTRRGGRRAAGAKRAARS